MNEKEAIDILKNCIADYVIGEYCSRCGDFQICESKNEDCYYLQAIETVLNLLENQDKEIEKFKNNNKDLLRKLRNRVKEVKKLEKYSTYKQEFSTLNKRLQKKDKQIEQYQNILATNDMLHVLECEKKDKIIDLMSEELSKLNYIQYCNVTNCNYPPCNKEECIKQYFERKVENGNGSMARYKTDMKGYIKCLI